MVNIVCWPEQERRGMPPLQCTPKRQANADWEPSAPSSSEKVCICLSATCTS